VHSALRQREPAINRARSGIRLGIMSAQDDQAPFSLAEFAVASIAIAAVVVIAFQGILGSRDPNLSAVNLSRPHLTSASGHSSLQVSQWLLGPEANMRTRPYRPSDVATVRKTEYSGPGIESSGPGSAAGNMPAWHTGRTNGLPAASFLAEAAPTTIVELQSPDIGGPPPPLIGPPDLFRMRNAIAAEPAKPIKGAKSSTRPERRESR
jgi:hypothetical protein